MEEIAQPTEGALPVGHSTFIPNEERKPRGGFLFGFVLGLLLGIAASLVLVPKTGDETREQIKEMSIVLKERAIGMMTGERPYEDEAPSTAG